MERDVPMIGSRMPAETMRRVWTMLAHHQGSLFNASSLARGLELNKPRRGFYEACVDLQAPERLIVHGGNDEYLLRENVQVIGLRRLVERLSQR